MYCALNWPKLLAAVATSALIATVAVGAAILIRPSQVGRAGVAVPQNFSDAQLVTNGFGWVLSQHHLIATSDGGTNFSDVTPALGQSSVLDAATFTDPLHGWVLATVNGSLIVVRTTDGGAHWLQATLPVVAPSQTALVDAYFDFPTQSQGWLDVRVSNRGSSSGRVLRTQDAGASWLEQAVAEFGAIRFTSAGDGWMVANFHLNVTHDGGRTWSRTSLPATGMTTLGRHRGPSEAAVVGVDEIGQNGTHSLAIYQSSDGAQSWSATSAAPGNNGSVPEPTLLEAASSSAMFAYFGVGLTGEAPALDSSLDGARTWQVISTDPILIGATSLTFSDPLHGWLVGDRSGCRSGKSDCFYNQVLLSTSDGGRTWARVS